MYSPATAFEARYHPCRYGPGSRTARSSWRRRSDCTPRCSSCGSRKTIAGTSSCWQGAHPFLLEWTSTRAHAVTAEMTSMTMGRRSPSSGKTGVVRFELLCVRWQSYTREVQLPSTEKPDRPHITRPVVNPSVNLSPSPNEESTRSCLHATRGCGTGPGCRICTSPGSCTANCTLRWTPTRFRDGTRQGLPLVLFSVQPERFLSLKSPGAPHRKCSRQAGKWTNVSP